VTLHIVAGRNTRKETDRLCSDNKAGGRDGKAEIKLKKIETHTALVE
jgi:hypothetical protein